MIKLNKNKNIDIKKDFGFTKRDSGCIKGIAIIMLLFYHCFCDSDRLLGYSISFFPFSQSLIVSLSFTLKTCVSMFAFITGYGLLKSYNRIKSNDEREISKWLFSRWIKTISGFWFVYLLSFIVTLIVKYPVKIYFKNGIVRGILFITADFLGISSLLNTPSLNNTWWYMGAAQLFIFLIPVFSKVIKKIGCLQLIALLVFFPRIIGIGFPGTVNPYSFILAFVFGIVFSQYAIFERIDKLFLKNKTVVLLLSAFILIISVTICLYSPLDLFWEYNYVIVAIIEIVFFYLWIIRLNLTIIKSLSYHIGLHSMNIFLIHTFFRDVFFKDFIYGLKHFILIVFSLLIISYLISYIIELLKRTVKFDKLISSLQEKTITIMYKDYLYD